jgi:hypothetical protein
MMATIANKTVVRRLKLARLNLMGWTPPGSIDVP